MLPSQSPADDHNAGNIVNAGGTPAGSAAPTGPAPVADMGSTPVAQLSGNRPSTPSTPRRPAGGATASKASKAPVGGSSAARAAKPGSTPSPAKTGGSQPRVRKQKIPPSASNGEDSDGTSSKAPPAKKHKVTGANSGQSSPGPKKTQTSGGATSAAPLANSTPARRPRGRPPKNGTAAAPARPKSEGSPGAEGARRTGKKNAAKPVLPWTAPPDESRRFVQDETNLLENGLYADATVICLKDQFKVHRSVLCTRSKWFYNALNGDEEGGQTGVVNLHSTPKEDVEILLKYIYSGKLDVEKFGPGKCDFVTYTRLYNLGQTFEYKPLSDDALTLLGQYCDKKLAEICSYDINESGRKGVVDQIRGNPDTFINDLLRAVRVAYDDTEQSTSLQSLFVSFIWAGRDRLFQCKELMAFADQYPRFGTDMFKMMLGHNPCKWFPSNISRTMCVTLDHSRKTQHPDRCEGCDDVFDEAKVRKALYNPFNVAVRASAWCAPCVQKHQGPAPLWRTPGNEEEKE